MPQQLLQLYMIFQQYNYKKNMTDLSHSLCFANCRHKLCPSLLALPCTHKPTHDLTHCGCTCQCAFQFPRPGSPSDGSKGSGRLGRPGTRELLPSTTGPLATSSGVRKRKEAGERRE